MIQYTSVDRILSKIHRELKDSEINEGDVIEWIGEALSFLQVFEILGQYVVFIDVENYQAKLPDNLYKILQIGRLSNEGCGRVIIPENVIKDITEENLKSCSACDKIEYDCDGNKISSFEFRPYFDMQWQYNKWTVNSYYKNNYVPVKLSSNILFNSIVCKESDFENIYSNCKDEYTIVGITDKFLRFSFREGRISLAYLKIEVDSDTGYPLIPDDIRYTTAITYYIKWKIAQIESWNGREGFSKIAMDNERLWLKYAKQAKNYMKMPKTLDEYLNRINNRFKLTDKYY